MSSFVTETAQVGGKEMTFEVGRLAAQATAAVVGRLGDSMVLVTVVAGNPRDDISWFPLQVEFQEKLYAGGKIKGSRWVKREGRPSDEAVLTSRVIDRSIRPLFVDGYKSEVQVVITPLSADKQNPLDILSLCTVSATLSLAGLPWEGPLAGMRIGMDEAGAFIANPTFEQQKTSKLDLIVSSTEHAVVMVEAGANEVTEDEVVGALEFAQQESKSVREAIERLVAKVGKPKLAFVATEALSEAIMAKLKDQGMPIILSLLASEKNGKINKEPLYAIIDAIHAEHEETKKALMKAYLDKLFKQAARDKIISTKTRLDGRKVDEIRPITIDVGMIPRTHGSGMFQRGETQALTLTTLASPHYNQMIELMEEEIDKRYIHHYIMPPYSVGETGRIGWPSRREIGHGALAERALVPVLPDEDDFPYAIRLVSECVSSNGSTSMASTCGSTLSLMDAGVPIKKPVAGIAMGLMVQDEEKGLAGDYVVLTDIQGLEDHIGDMDFKVAGTADGVTAIQMDIKLKGVTSDLLKQALTQAKKARLEILEKMNAVISKPRETVSQFAPKIRVLRIDKERIGDVIGPGGKMIRSIIEKTGAEVDINDEGRVVVTCVDAEKMEEALKWITGLTRSIEAGEEFEGPVTRILDFGAFVEILPNREGMVHVSKIANGYLASPHDVLHVDQVVKVKVEEIDDMGRLNLTMLFGDNAMTAPAGSVRGDRPPMSGGRDRFDRRGGGRSFGDRPRGGAMPTGRQGFGGGDRGGNRGAMPTGRQGFGGNDRRSGPRFGGNERGRQDSQSGGFSRPQRPQRTTTTPKTMADWNKD